MRLLLFLSIICFLACGKKQEKTTTAAATTTAIVPTEQVKTPKTMLDYLEAYKKADEIDPLRDTVIIHEQTDNFIRFEHSPKENELGGVCFVSLCKLKTETDAPKFASFMHACVEGSCNLDANYLRVWSADFTDISANCLDRAAVKAEFDKQVKKLAKNPKKKRYNSFFALLFGDEGKIQWGIIDAEDQNMMQGKSIDTDIESRNDLYWNVEKQKFQKEFPYAG